MKNDRILREVFQQLKAIHDESPIDFLEVTYSAFLKFGVVLESVFDVTDEKNGAIVPFLANGLYEHFHETRIEKLEGFSCSADKARFIRNMTLKALKEDKNISLYDDYTKVDRIKEDKERQAYWSPTTVKDTDEAIELFWNWYQ